MPVEPQRYRDHEPPGHRDAGPGRYAYHGDPAYREERAYPEERAYRDVGLDRRERGYRGGRGYQDEDGYRGERGRRSAGPDQRWYRDDPAPAWEYWDDEDHEYPDGGDNATGGVAGNERLTGLIGLALLVLFAVEGFTVLAVRQMLTLHFFVGMLLVGPVLLKLCSTGYRFTRYYSGDPGYRRKGPPAPWLRVLGPVVILTSLAVIGTGVMLALAGPGRGVFLLAHKAAFVLWFGAMTVHVLAYVWRLPRLVGSDLARRAGHRAEEVLGGRAARWLLLTASLLTGLLLAVLTVHLAGPWAAASGAGG
jgi:hypothetical protein